MPVGASCTPGVIEHWRITALESPPLRPRDSASARICGADKSVFVQPGPGAEQSSNPRGLRAGLAHGRTVHMQRERVV